MKKRAVPARNYFLKDINPVVRFMILSESIATGSVGLLGPIFALFIEDFIIGSNEAVVGMAAGIYLLSRSTLQIPVAHFLDKVRGERDDFWVLFTCSSLTALVPILYLFINTPVELYAVQFLLGILAASTYPSFLAIMTRHIDRGQEGTEWSIYFTLTDITSATFAMIGGLLVVSTGFPILITIVVATSLMSTMMLLPIRRYLKVR